MKAVSFVKGIGWAVVLNVLIKPLWIFGIDRQLQNEVGHQAYGTYFSMLNLCIIFSFLADAGISNLANIRLAGGTALNRKSLLQLKFRLSALYAGIVFMVAAISGITNYKLLLLVVLIQVLTSLFVFLRSIVTANQLFTADAFLSVLDKALMLLLLGPLLYVPLLSHSISIAFFLTIQLCCTALAVSIAAIIISNKKLFQSTHDGGNKMHYLVAALPFAAIILLMSALNRADGFLLERMHHDGALQAGIYASAYRLLDAGNMVGYLFAAFLVPFIARNLPHKILLQKTILNVRHFLLVSGAAVMVFVCVYANEVQQLLYHFADPFATKVLQLCIAVLPAYLILHIYGSLLTAGLWLKTLIYFLSVSVVLNIALNVVLIPLYGAVGCCIAALISQYLCAMAVMIAATKKSGTRIHSSSFVWYLFLISCFGWIFYVLKKQAFHPLLLIPVVVLLLCLLLFVYIPFVKKTFLLSH